MHASKGYQEFIRLTILQTSILDGTLHCRESKVPDDLSNIEPADISGAEKLTSDAVGLGGGGNPIGELILMK